MAVNPVEVVSSYTEGRVHLGNVELHIVSDGVTWSDGGRPFGLVPIRS